MKTADETPVPSRVLLVEDDESVAWGLTMLLEAEGIEVAVARTGAAAIGMLASGRPDAVVLDVGLPDIDGVDLFRRIRANDASLPIVVSSGNANGLRFEELQRSNRVRLLIKPYEIGDLLHALEELRVRAHK